MSAQLGRHRRHGVRCERGPDSRWSTPPHSRSSKNRIHFAAGILLLEPSLLLERRGKIGGDPARAAAVRPGCAAALCCPAPESIPTPLAPPPPIFPATFRLLRRLRRYFAVSGLPRRQDGRTGEKWRKMGEFGGETAEKQWWLSGAGHSAVCRGGPRGFGEQGAAAPAEVCPDAVRSWRTEHSGAARPRRGLLCSELGWTANDERRNQRPLRSRGPPGRLSGLRPCMRHVGLYGSPL